MKMTHILVFILIASLIALNILVYIPDENERLRDRVYKITITEREILEKLERGDCTDKDIEQFEALGQEADSIFKVLKTQ